jgi:hypothetical protein
MAQAHPYHQLFNSLAAKDINVGSDTFKCALLTNAYVPNLGTHQFYSSCSASELPSGSGYTTGGAVISGMAASVSVSTNCVQVVTISGSPTGGTFTLTVVIGTNSQTSGTIAYNASAATVETALQAMGNIGAIPSGGTSNVAVTGSSGGPWTITFQNALGDQVVALMTANSSGLTGGSSPAATPTMSTAGQGTWNISGGNVSWTSATFTSPNAAHFGVVYDTTPGSSSTDPLVGLIDFVSDQSPTNGTLSITWDATGIIVVQVS